MQKKTLSLEDNKQIKQQENCELKNKKTKPVYLQDLRKKSISELLDFSTQHTLNINYDGVLKHELIFNIIKQLAENDNIIIGGGTVEILPDGFAFTRSVETNYLASSDDIYVSPGQVKRLNLRTGNIVAGEIRPPRKEERYFSLVKGITVNDFNVENPRHFIHFDNLIPVYPDQQMILECASTFDVKDISTRLIDIVIPLGLGQRALIVAPPKTGKTVLLQNIAHAITVNYPNTKLMMLLIDERPEEVTDMQRSVNGEVVSSTFDEPAHRHVQLAEIVIEKARRMVEAKQDVVILLDSITRLSRAYNTVVPSSGKVLTGGVDSNALQRPKRLFGAARNIENGGSLTIIATALVDTGSRMDDIIFEEFKGTGNAEIILDRKIADKRIFPAIDIIKSGTRNEELLLDKKVLNKTWVLRRILSQMTPVEAIEFLRDRLVMTKSNYQFFDSMNS